MKNFILLISVFLISACSNQSEGPEAPKGERFIIIGSYLAEIIVELDGADHIVGVSTGAEHIEELADVPVIPGFRNTSAEAMLALNPTVAFLAGSQTRPEIPAQLQAAGVKVHFFADDVASLDVIPDRIFEIGEILGLQQEAADLEKRYEAEVNEVLEYVAKATSKPKGLFILSGGGRPTVVAGENSHIALLLELAGAENMTKGIKNFKPMSQEAMLEAAPEFILVNVEGLELNGGVPTALKAPGALLTPAGQNDNIFALPNGHLRGLGLYTPAAIRGIAEKIHPELSR